VKPFFDVIRYNTKNYRIFLYGSREYLFLANQGKMDSYFGERSTQELAFDRQGNIITGTRPHTVGGEKMETIASQVNAFGKDYLNKELGKAAITVKDGKMMPGATDARGGDFRYEGSDGNWYRLGVEGRKGSFIIEQLKGGKWKKIDVRKLPVYEEREKRFLQENLNSGGFGDL
jgi:hypothetical protein